MKRNSYIHGKTTWSANKALCMYCEIDLEWEFEVNTGLCFKCDKIMRKANGWNELADEFKGWTQ